MAMMLRVDFTAYWRC